MTGFYVYTIRHLMVCLAFARSVMRTICLCETNATTSCTSQVEVPFTAKELRRVKRRMWLG